MILFLSTSLTAHAHEAMEDPIPRYESDGYSANKACPCGMGDNDRTCSNSNARSDPNRSTDRINEYASGETITVRLHEVVGHSGRWRIAFDTDGADMDDFNANILLDEPDPPGDNGNTGNGDLWEFTVTLPDVACDNCTLQVLQIMNGVPNEPVGDPTGDSTYWQCADVVLTGGPPPPDDGDVPDPPAVEPADEEACGCAASPSPGAGALLAFFLLRRRTVTAARLSPRR